MSQQPNQPDAVRKAIEVLQQFAAKFHAGLISHTDYDYPIYQRAAESLEELRSLRGGGSGGTLPVDAKIGHAIAAVQKCIEDAEQEYNDLAADVQEGGTVKPETWSKLAAHHTGLTNAIAALQGGGSGEVGGTLPVDARVSDECLAQQIGDMEADKDHNYGEEYLAVCLDLRDARTKLAALQSRPASEIEISPTQHFDVKGRGTVWIINENPSIRLGSIVVMNGDRYTVTAIERDGNNGMGLFLRPTVSRPATEAFADASWYGPGYVTCKACGVIQVRSVEHPGTVEKTAAPSECPTCATVREKVIALQASIGAKLLTSPLPPMFYLSEIEITKKLDEILEVFNAALAVRPEKGGEATKHSD